MQLDVQVISEEIVKPSSPTDDRLRRYQLSFLDQQTPLLYNAMVYFYQKICNTEANKITIFDRLKHSISNALTCFYPLAGRIMEDQLFVDCNDEGIPFLEARVKCQLLDVLNNPTPKELNKLLPFEFHVSGTDAEHVLLGIQFNVFDCGGIGIGVCISHKIGDALSFFSFVNIWASIARGETNLIVPEFRSASLFPPRAIPEAPQLKKEQIVTKRFVFGATKVEEIRRNYGENTSQKRPSRVEALSAFIWDRFVTAFGLRSRPDTLCTIIHAVNLRARIDPPLPGSSFGNLYSLAVTIPSMDNNIVTQIRDSFKALNSEYVKKLQDGNDHLKYFRERTNYAKGEILTFGFTSLCRLPMYEADFGWGKPIWASSVDRQIKNVTTFMDTINGDGIEAWIALNEEEMAKFDCDEELLAYVNNPKSLQR
ncbi:hypothetical protein ERO13_D10G181500v2 [Gossypium hirsutum]|uniref:Stemmadenine O-acetyltransferase n=1 Tax=Gossypium hirsutum TaxID=3635 RepID=A0A1U8KCN8_GOSHI|nr:stemmadenine O-acetyltransferase-like [Gossypium hirsutum]KAG4126858.1 hypothetical protein ERO13_D10G181500v2 [Gossypium hirsutum]